MSAEPEVPKFHKGQRVFREGRGPGTIVGWWYGVRYDDPDPPVVPYSYANEFELRPIGECLTCGQEIPGR